MLDLAPGRSVERLARDLARQDSKASFANRLRKGAGIDGVKIALLRTFAPPAALADPEKLARQIKATPLAVLRP
ncbi:hypothetical protein NZA98_25305, partial [Escherichia coli]|nr:hypothetical protein [Escherichia coli]